jgi:hypothetical protein
MVPFMVEGFWISSVAVRVAVVEPSLGELANAEYRCKKEAKDARHHP